MRYPTLIILIAFILSGCGGSTPNTNTTRSASPDKVEADVEPAVITFDDSMGEASIVRNFYFLFDISGSMSESCAGRRKIDGAKSAIFEFLQVVPEDVNIGLLLFGVKNKYGIEEVIPLGQDNLAKFKEEINKTKPTGGTPLANAVKFGTKALVDQYKQQMGYGEYRLIVITDGIAAEPEVFEKALISLKKYPFIATYGIGLCISTGHVLQQYSIKYSDAYDYQEFGKALQETVAELEDFNPDDVDLSDFQE